MFDRYSVSARRVIFFAREEAGRAGAAEMEPNHFLFGVCQEDAVLVDNLIHAGAAEAIRSRIESAPVAEPSVPTSTDMRLSRESTHVLKFAEDEAKRLTSKTIETRHLILGLLREESCGAAEILREYGLQLSLLRSRFASDKAQ